MPRFCVKAINARGTAQDFGGIDVMRSLLSRRVGRFPQMVFVRDVNRHIDSRLKETRHPTCSEDEVYGYVYEIAQDGKPNRDRPDASCPDHGMDSARYGGVFFEGHDWADRKTRLRFTRNQIGGSPTWPGNLTFEEWWEGLN